MDAQNECRWPPSAELLAAYCDGEFEGRDDLARLCRRLEDWLAASPCARAELAKYRRLRQLWRETTPDSPPPASWHEILRCLEAYQSSSALARKPSRGVRRAAAIFLGAAACLLLTALLIKDGAKIHEVNEPFPVASESEVVILHVEGADTGTLVVGQLPVQGPLELAGPGDVTFTSVAPADRDHMLPEVHVGGPGRPMIWARAEAEED